MERIYKIFSIFSCALLLTVGLTAQDLHYSYYHFMPASVNPANVGAFYGSYRVAGIYTSKDGGLADKSFKNFSLSADAPLVRGIRKQDWIGVGVQADVFGALNGSGDLSNETRQTGFEKYAQNWTFMKFSASYHLSLDKAQKNIFTLGAQFNTGRRMFGGFTFNDTRNGIINQVDLDLQNYQQISSSNDPDKNTKYTSQDLGVGLLFNARRDKSDLRIGIAAEGLLSPKLGLFSKSVRKIKLPEPGPNPPKDPVTSGVSKDSLETKFFGLNIHGDYVLDITPRTSIDPSFYFYNLGKFNAFNVNSRIWYQINPDQDFKGGAGLGLRDFRDVILYVGARFSDFEVGMAYDLNINDRTLASNGFGGFEIAARYLGKIYKKPKVKPIIFCPRM